VGSADNQLIYNVLTANLKEALNKEAVIKETKIINSGNVGEFYKHVNKRLNQRTGIPPILTSNNVIVVSDLEKADCFSEYYAKIGTIDNNCIPDNWSASEGLSNGSAISEPKKMSTFDINCVEFSDVFYPLTKLRLSCVKVLLDLI